MPSRILFRGARVVLDGELAPLDVLCEEGRIVSVAAQLDAGGAELVDAAGHTLGPGFVDVHVHGGGGSSFFTRDAQRLAAYSAWAPGAGVTSYLVSTAGRHPADLLRTLEGLAPAIGHAPGAESLGFHLEGPFINPQRKGAFDAATLQPPSTSGLERAFDVAEGKVRQVTLAPELPGAAELVELCARRGAVAAMGHSDATYAEAGAAINAGASHVTHLFNAMRPLHQREGGIAAAGLLDDRVTCELICDTEHVSVEMLRLAFRMLGSRRMVCVTDNMHLAGTPATRTEFMNGSVSVQGDAARKDDGTLVGSVLPMDGHFRNLVERVGLTVAEAFQVCSTNPAAVAGVAGRKGRIAPGFDADLVLLDSSHHVVSTYCRGLLAYTSPASTGPARE